MIIGISGHQDLGSEDDIIWIKAKIISAICDYPSFVGQSSLAIGADQLFAQITIDLGQPLSVVIPCTHYKDTFKSATSLQNFYKLKNLAQNEITLPFTTPTEQAFYTAGCHIVDTSELMLFVWNGRPAKGFGGTADIVKYALTQKKSYIHINTVARTITSS